MTPPSTGTGGLDGRLRATQATASARPSRSTRIFMSVLPQVGMTDRGDGRSNVAKRWELWGVNRWEADLVRLRWVEPGSNLLAWLLHRRASGALTSSRGGERGSAVRALVPGFRHPLFFFCSSLQERTTAVTVRAVDCVDNDHPRRSGPLRTCGQLGGATRGQLGAPGDNSGTAPFGPQEGRVVPGCIPGCGCSCTRVLHRVRSPKLPRSDNFSEVVHRLIPVVHEKSRGASAAFRPLGGAGSGSRRGVRVAPEGVPEKFGGPARTPFGGAGISGRALATGRGRRRKGRR